MIFCKICGEALNLFETHDERVCYACLRNGLQRQEKPKSSEPADAGDNPEPLADAQLGREGNQLVLRSAEGWILWSGSDGETHSLGPILTKARRINEIRKKRRK